MRDRLTEKQIEFIGEQPLFLVATANLIVGG